jgi:hypothetical protein
MAKSAMVAILFAALAALPAYGQTRHAAPAGSSPSAGAAATQGLAANQFSTEQAAKTHCPGDTIVWANLSGSKAYHTSGDRYYGKTRHGAFMCEKDATQAGYHAAGAHARKTATKAANTANTKNTTK